ncbi:MAG: hypothetical protein AAF456_16015 [Planctomycetota bacterium]
MDSNQITIAQMLGACQRHKFKSFMTFLLVLVVVAAGFLIWPRKYSSEGQMNVQLVARDSISVNPASGNETVSIQDTRETEIRSAVEVIQSRAVIEAVVEEIGADEILKSPWDDLIPIQLPEISLPEFSSGGGDGGMTAEEYKEAKKRHLAARRLEKDMKVVSEKKTSIISITIKARNASLAQRLVDSIMEHAKLKMQEANSVLGSTEYYNTKFEEQQLLLEEAIASQVEFRNRRQSLSLGGDRATLQGIITRLENDLITAETALVGASQRVEKLELEIAEIEETISVPTSGVEKKSYEDSRTELFKLEGRLAEAIGTFNENHPRVEQIQRQVDEYRATLAELEGERTEYETAQNEVYDAVNISLVEARADQDAAQATLDDVVAKMENARTRLVALNDAEIEADRLQRNIDVQRDYISIFQRKRGESKALDEFDIDPLVVFQPATLVVKHVSPRGSIIAPLGVMLALLCALGTALYYERNHLSGTLGEDEVEQILELPVLVTLPRVYSSRNMVN